MERIEEAVEAFRPYKRIAQTCKEKRRNAFSLAICPMTNARKFRADILYNVNNSHDCVGDFQLGRAVRTFEN